jgi:hypothetical protein
VERVESEGGEAWVFKSHWYVGTMPWRRRRIRTSESLAERDFRREDSGDGVGNSDDDLRVTFGPRPRIGRYLPRTERRRVRVCAFIWCVMMSREY